MSEPLGVGTAPSRAPAHEGHNSVAGEQLRQIVERIERLDGEIAALNDDKKDIYAEAKGNGFDTKIIKKIVAMRRKDDDERREEELLLEVYLHAMGMA
jgi:uncharacterized protein (UPF0335 family)